MDYLTKRMNAGFTNKPPKPGEFWRLGFNKSDGGRKAAGYKGHASDCVTRALSIVTSIRKPTLAPGEIYQAAYDEITERQKEYFENSRSKKLGKKPGTARTGVYKKVTKQLMKDYGGVWNATMGIGTGCQVHLRADELPAGLLVVSVSKHITVVKDHVIIDTHNPDRKGTRCVYGYWKFEF